MEKGTGELCHKIRQKVPAQGEKICEMMFQTDVLVSITTSINLKGI